MHSEEWTGKDCKEGKIYSFPVAITAQSRRINKKEEPLELRAFLYGFLYKIEKEAYKFIGVMINSKEDFYFFIPKKSYQQELEEKEKIEKLAELYSEAT